MPSAAQKQQAAKAQSALKEQIPEPRCELDHESGWQLLVATILSAQTTDRTVNKVTPALFARFPTPAALAAADPGEVEALIKPTGFFRSKAKSIQETARLVAENHGGLVPRTMEALSELRGVARKTANVVLGTAFGIAEGITVDVHAARVSQRLGLTRHAEPAKIELDLMALFPKEAWIDLGHRLVLHGRYTCLARGPRCMACACRTFCPTGKELLAETAKGKKSKVKSRKSKDPSKGRGRTTAPSRSRG